MFLVFTCAATGVLSVVDQVSSGNQNRIAALALTFPDNSTMIPFLRFLKHCEHTKFLSGEILNTACIQAATGFLAALLKVFGADENSVAALTLTLPDNGPVFPLFCGLNSG
jgi:hypothetical protein